MGQQYKEHPSTPPQIIPTIMKILIASDKFKGSLTATDVNQAIQKGISNQNPNHQITIQSMADGGDGSIDLLDELWELEQHTVTVNDPIFKKIKAHYYTQKDIAFIEMSKASGLALLKKEEQNPLHTTSFGTGELILDAYQKGFKIIKLFIGGSATNDGGIGIASALGYSFFNINGQKIEPTGEYLEHIHFFDKSQLAEAVQQLDIQVICDVNNPFFGAKGAAYVYAQQKGADDAMIKKLDEGLRNLHQVFIENGLTDVQKIAGTGAAGGIGGGMIALFGATQTPGIELFIELFQLEKKVKEADFVITGEGRLDSQSFDGKVVGGIHQLCKKHQKPMVVVCGQHLNPSHQTFDFPIFTIIERATSVKDAIQNGAKYLEMIGEELNLIDNVF
jgi:glycerate kinase